MTTFGYLFSRSGEKLAAYLSDCKEVPPQVIEQIRGVRHLIVDALRSKPHPTHMSVDEALAVGVAAEASQTWLTHLSHDLQHAELEASLPAEARVAFDGLKVNV